jgi:hypothetical protein
MDFEGWTIPKLRKYALASLLDYPTNDELKQIKVRGGVKKLIIDYLKKNKRNPSRYTPLQLHEYINQHDLLDPGSSASKDELIDIINNNTKAKNILKAPQFKKINVKQQSQEEIPQITDVLFLTLLPVNIETLFRLYCMSAQVRKTLTQFYWAERLKKEQFVVPRYKVDLKQHYLVVTKYPIVGEIWAWGYNGDGYLGFKSSKKLIEEPTQLEFDAVVGISEGTVFLLKDGSVYSAGENLGWGEESKAIDKKIQKVPPQRIVDLPPIKLIDSVHNAFFYITQNGELWYRIFTFRNKSHYSRQLATETKFVQLVGSHPTNTINTAVIAAVDITGRLWTGYVEEENVQIDINSTDLEKVSIMRGDDELTLQTADDRQYRIVYAKVNAPGKPMVSIERIDLVPKIGHMKMYQYTLPSSQIQRHQKDVFILERLNLFNKWNIKYIGFMIRCLWLNEHLTTEEKQNIISSIFPFRRFF